MDQFMTLTINFNSLKYRVFRIYIPFVFTSNCLCLQLLSCRFTNFKHMIRMAAASKTGIKHNLFSIQETLDIVKSEDAT